MKRKVVFLCFILLLFSMAVAASAEELSSVSATVNSEGLVTISGKISEGAGRMVNIMVHDPNGSLNYMNTCLSGNDGLFRVSYVMVNADGGEYTVTIGTKGAVNVAAASFVHSAKNCDVTAILEDGIVKVAGTAGTEAGRMIAVRITAPNSATEYIGNVTSGNGGVFGFSYALANTQTGKYTVYAGVSGTKTPAVCYFLAGVQADIKAKIDDQKLVTVEGTVSAPEKPVSVRITDPKGNTEYLSGVFSKADGTFSLSFTMTNEEKGRYKVSVSCGSLETPVTAEFVYGKGLQNLQLNNPSTSYTPAFESNHKEYSANVSYTTESISIKAFAMDAAAKVIINGSQVTNGTASAPISLKVGLNTLQVQVIEKDGRETSYNIHITREKAPPPALSGNANLSALSLSSGALNEVFTAGVTQYTAIVPNGTSSVTVFYTVADNTASVAVSGASPLRVGANTVTVTVTAQNGSVKVYTITVTRAPSGNAFLRSLTVSPGTLSSAFSPVVSSYTVNTGNAVSAITITPTAWDTTARITVNGITVRSGSASETIPINVGNNYVPVVVTAEDGSETTYVLTVVRAMSGNANLSSITANEGTLNPAFTSSTTNYTVTVDNSVTSITLGITTDDEHATFTVNGAHGYDNSRPYTEHNLNVGQTAVTIAVTAQDGTVKTYTVTIIRQSSSNANLSDIGLSRGVIAGFNPNVTDYTVQVDHVDSYIRVTPYAENALAVIRVNGSVVASGGTSNPIDLAYGSNAVSIQVIAPDGVSEKTYHLTVNRAYNLNLSALTLRSSPGDGSINLTPSGTNNYTAGVVNSVTGVTVTPTAQAAGTTVIRVNGNIVSSGSASQPVSLNVGENTITVTLTAPDNTSKTYTIVVTRAAFIDASLSSLVLSAGELTFSSSTTYYEVEVPNTAGTITVTPTTTDPSATVTVNDQAAPAAVNLEFGINNLITVRVTARNGTTTQNYIIRVNRPLSTDATLSALTVSAGSLSPLFSPSVTNYTVNVDHSTDSITITPIANNPNYYRIHVDGTAVSSGSASSPIGLPVGSKTITIRVWPQTGAYKDYTVTFVRTGSSNANLSALTLNPGGLNESFSSDVTEYTADVPNGTSSVSMNYTVADNTATVTVSGAASLSVGANTVTVTVTAQNGSSKVYTIIVTRAPSGNANLNSLTLSTGTLNPAFSTGVTEYTADVPNETSSVTVDYTVADNTATVEVSGAASLSVGDNTITVTVTAQNGSPKVYTITVTRAPSSNTNLNSLTLSTGTLSPAFSSGVTDYTADVPNGTSSVTVDYTVADNNATVEVSGAASLNVGTNTITVTVTAQNGSSKVYTITVTRAPSGNANLNSLTLSTGSLTPVFSANTTEYTANVPNETTSVTPIYALADNTASALVNGGVLLNVGANIITITVTAQNGTSKVYKITVTRAPSANANLAGLTLSTGSLTPAFSADVTEYTADMPNATGSITVTTATEDSSASMEVIWNNVGIIGSGEYTSSLNVGSNVIRISVTAENGTRKTYTLTITRAGSSNANLKSLGVLRWGLDSSFDEDDTSYVTQVYSDTKSIQITAEVDDVNATVTVNGSDDFTVNLDLAEDSKEITVAVTAQDGTTKNYIITVNRSKEAEPKYNIIIDGNMYGGSITANATEMVEGGTVHLTVTPNDGYRLQEGTLRYVVQTEISSEEYPIAGNSFTMPAKDVVIRATFELIEE